jgi:hypothetical protein
MSAIIAATGLYAAYQGEMPWWPGIVFAVGAVVLLLSPLVIPPFADDLEISDSGIRRTFGPRYRARQVEAVTWDALSKVEILTTDAGPGAEDMFFLLEGADGTGVVVGNGLAVKHRLVAELQRRLPGYDNRAVVLASGSTMNARFPVWQKDSST